MAGESLFFWLGASAETAETGSSSLRSPEPLRVSAHAGDDPARKVVAQAVAAALRPYSKYFPEVSAEWLARRCADEAVYALIGRTA